MRCAPLARSGLGGQMRRGAPAAAWRPMSSKVPADSNAIAVKESVDDSVSTEADPEIDPETMTAFTGAPAGMLRNRVVKIYQQAQTVQNATQNMVPWRLQWEDKQTKRWPNPLMGWTSTSDPLSNTHMTLEFQTPDDAARFCKQNGEQCPA